MKKSIRYISIVIAAFISSVLICLVNARADEVLSEDNNFDIDIELIDYDDNVIFDNGSNYSYEDSILPSDYEADSLKSPDSENADEMMTATKLYAPTNISWSKDTGILSFDRPSNSLGMYAIKYYRINDSSDDSKDNSKATLIGTHNLTYITDKSVISVGVEPAILEKMTSGNYYVEMFTSHGANDNYTNSDAVKSNIFTYTRPISKMATPSGLTWKNTQASWTYSDAGAAYVQLYYSQTSSGTFKYLCSVKNSRNPSSTEVHTSIDYLKNYVKEDGYYVFRVKMLSNNIYKTLDSDWSAVSKTITYYGASETLATQLSAILSDKEKTADDIKSFLLSANQSELKKALYDGSSFADVFAEAESRYAQAKGLTIDINIKDNIKSVITGSVNIIGASFLARSNNSKISFNVEKVSEKHDFDNTLYGVARTVCMRLDGVRDYTKLDLPVRIEMDPPSGISSSSLTIMHFTGYDTYETVPYKIKNGKIVFSLDHFSDFAFVSTASASLPFSDVASSAWYYNAVKYVYDKGIMNGNGKTDIFDPLTECTREMMVTICYRLDKTATNPMTRLADSLPFTDVDSKRWYYEGLRWGYGNDIIKGISSDSFGTGKNVTREQVAVMLYNYAKKAGYNVSAASDLSKFTDSSKISSWADAALKWANYKGIIKGKSDNTLDPKGVATRAEIAQMIYNFSGLSK